MYCPHCNYFYLGNISRCPECGRAIESHPASPTVSTTRNHSSVAVNMSEPENFGDYILAFSIIALVVNILATVICSFVFGKNLSGEFDFGSFILILLSELGSSIIFFLFTRGFGHLVKSSISTAENSEMSLHYIQKIEEAQRMSAASKDNKGT